MLVLFYIGKIDWRSVPFQLQLRPYCIKGFFVLLFYREAVEPEL